MKDKRKLTEKEQKRVERLEVIEKELEKEGYEKTDLTVSMLKANVVGILTPLPFVIIFALLFILINKEFTPDESGLKGFLVFVAFFVSIPIHELIHGITFSLFSKNGWKDIEFGVVWECLTPYCTCGTPVSKKGYYCSILMPCIVLGIIPSIIAIVINSVYLLTYGILMTLAAGGDLLITLLILKNKTKNEAIYLDHPTDCGVLKFEKRSE